MMMQEISKQMGADKNKEQEKQAEIDKLKQDIKKLEQDKKNLETQVVGLTMQVQKDCDMIVQF
jgi:flagellar motility protein MotE (MotC chaperone)